MREIPLLELITSLMIAKLNGTRCAKFHRTMLAKGPRQRLLLFSAFALVTYSFLFIGIQVQAGTNISGGGFGLQSTTGAPIQMLDAFELQPVPVDQCATYPGDRVQVTPFGKRYGFFPATIDRLQAYSLAVQRIRRWSQTSPVFTKLILFQLKEIGLQFAGHIPAPQNSNAYSLPPGLKPTRLPVPAALYLKSGLGFFLSLPVWNSMCGMSQAALLVHEALRGLQIDLGSLVDSETIQLLTAMAIWGSPKTMGSLDEFPFANFLVTRQIGHWLLSKHSLSDRHALRTEACGILNHQGHMKRIFLLMAEAEQSHPVIARLVINHLRHLSNSLTHACASHHHFGPFRFEQILQAATAGFMLQMASCGYNRVCLSAKDPLARKMTKLFDAALKFAQILPDHQSMLLFAANDNLSRVSQTLSRLYPFLRGEKQMNLYLSKKPSTITPEQFQLLDHTFLKLRPLFTKR